MNYKADSLLKSHFFNFFIQIINILFPFISIPYITRIFGPEVLGKVNFANSIVQYFIMLASLGIPVYAVREISKVRDDSFRLRKLLKEVSILQTIFTFISSCLFLLLINNLSIIREDINLYLLLGLQIISNYFNFIWFIQGIEKYRYVVISNLLIKFVNIVLIFILINSQDDYYKYAFIIGFCSVLTSFINMIISINLLKLFKYDKNVYTNLYDIRIHIQPIAIFFLSNIAVNIYTSMDQTMLGFMSGEGAVGLYSMSMRIVKIILSLVTSISVVMIPRISNSIKNNSIDEIRNYLKISINLVCLISIPCIFGIFAMGEELLLVYLGEKFTDSILVFKYVSLLLIIIGLSNVFGMQIMIPYGMEKKFTIILSIAAIINFILNIILIPKLSYIGTVISTLIAESLVTYLMYLKVKHIVGELGIKEIVYKKILSSIVFYIFIVAFIKPSIESSIITILISIPISLITYMTGLFILKDELILNVIDNLKNKKY